MGYLDRLKAFESEKCPRTPLQKLQKLQKGPSCTSCSTQDGRFQKIAPASDLGIASRAAEPVVPAVRQPSAPLTAAEEKAIRALRQAEVDAFGGDYRDPKEKKADPALAANEDSCPEAARRCWRIDGSLHSFTPPASEEEVGIWYPVARIEPQTEREAPPGIGEILRDNVCHTHAQRQEKKRAKHWP